MLKRKDFRVSLKNIPTLDGRKITPYEYLESIRKHWEEMRNRNYVPKYYSAPLACQLELTYRCNQKCIHCYNNSGDSHAFSGELTIDEWINVCYQLKEMDIFQCIISGGEPTLLGDNLFKLMDILSENNTSFIVISNGILINREMAQKFSKYKFDWFQISIDGSRPEIHDYIRGCPSWHKALKAVRFLKEENIPVIIAHTVTKINKNYIDEMIELAYLLGADGIIIGPADYLGRAIKNIEELKLSEKEISQIYEYIIKKREENQGRIEIIVALEEVLALRMKLYDKSNDVLLIRPNGDVKFDCIAPFKIGNLKEETLQDIWNKKGKHIWQHSKVQNYVNQIKSKQDLIYKKPRPGVDPDESIN